MKALLIFDKYKGSLRALEVSEAVAKGLRKGLPDISTHHLPIADGGEGFTEVLVHAMKGELRTSVVEDALGREVEATWGLIPFGEGKQAAIIEMSAASGLWRIPESERNLMQASTYGTGQLIKTASETPEVAHIYVGLGGSATNDAGMGMAQALGVTLQGISGRACPKTLQTITGISTHDLPLLPPITVACDVDNPLCGENGASVVFGPQKGAQPEDLPPLDRLLARLAALTSRPDLQATPGAGAAGGLGFGLMVFTSANLVSGFELVSDALSLESRISEADIIITGEGGLDAQSLSGKGPMGVARLAQKHRKPCYAIAGSISPDIDWSLYFADTIALTDSGLPLPELITNAPQHLEEVATLLAQRIHQS